MSNIIVNNNSVYIEMAELSNGSVEFYWHDWVVNEWRQIFSTKKEAMKFIKQDILEGEKA